MPRKPTKIFGAMLFHKDGRVEPDLHRLPDEKSAQEAEVAQRFATHLSNPQAPVSVRLLPEADHDFVLCYPSGSEVLVQAVELVHWDYARKLSELEWLEGRTGHSEFIVAEGGGYWGVHERRRVAALTEKIQRKKARYARPKADLWLLIWSLYEDFTTIYYEAGSLQLSPAWREAERYLTAEGPGPFTQVWYLHPYGCPNRIWPQDPMLGFA